jgi:hypothetical protein
MLALNELLCYAAIAVVLGRKYRRNARKSREWIKKWLLKRHYFSHVSLLKQLRFHPKDWHNFLRTNESTYLTLLSMVSPPIQKKKHHKAASYNSTRETYSHFKIVGDREKLRGPQVFHYNVSTSTGKNYTRDLPCYLQRADGIL